MFAGHEGRDKLRDTSEASASHATGTFVQVTDEMATAMVRLPLMTVAVPIASEAIKIFT